jgi:vesicular inhibitory amino acid transporter
MTTGDHSSAAWLGATTFVAAYSGAIAVLVPFFCTLVGLVTSVTYLTCAYTLPAWFMLRLAKQGGSALVMRPGEKWLLTMIIPLSVIASAVGLAASLRTFVYEAGGGEGM